MRPERLLYKLKEITVTGFSTFFIDVAMGILTILFNRQIMIYLGTNALAVYGVIVNISTFVQCCSYSVGQASQPLYPPTLGREGRQDTGDAEIRPGDGSLFQPVLDGSCMQGKSIKAY